MLHRHGGHAEAVARIRWCVTETALGVITGEVGAGKTVALRAALAELDASRHTVIYLPNPAVGARGLTTASLPAPARAAAHQRALAVIATARVTTDRHRHRDHKIKTRQAFPHAPRGITTRTAPAHVHVCGTTAA